MLRPSVSVVFQNMQPEKINTSRTIILQFINMQIVRAFSKKKKKKKKKKNSLTRERELSLDGLLPSLHNRERKLAFHLYTIVKGRITTCFATWLNVPGQECEVLLMG